MSTFVIESRRQTRRGSRGPAAVLLTLAVVALAAVAVASGSTADLLAAVPFALLALALATRLYFGVETIVRLVERLRSPRRRAESARGPTGPSRCARPTPLLLAGNAASRAPPACAPALR